MSEESSNNELLTIEKLSIDNLSDFQFHAAYVAYAEIYDKTTSLETKKQLNQNIVALQQNKIDYQSFYRNINQYRSEEGSQYRYGRIVIKTQRKQDWRRQMQKEDRNKRFK